MICFGVLPAILGFNAELTSLFTSVSWNGFVIMFFDVAITHWSGNGISTILSPNLAGVVFPVSFSAIAASVGFLIDLTLDIPAPTTGIAPPSAAPSPISQAVPSLPSVSPRNLLVSIPPCTAPSPTLAPSPAHLPAIPRTPPGVAIVSPSPAHSLPAPYNPLSVFAPNACAPCDCCRAVSSLKN